MIERSILPWRRRDVDPPLAALHDAMNGVFDDFSRGWDIAPFRRGLLAEATTFIPRLEVSDDDKNVMVRAELPGLDEKDIDVSLTGNLLTLKGEKRSEKEEKKQNYYYKERSYGAFERAVDLPCEVDRERAQATFKKGVLCINLPKTPQAQSSTRKIAVKTET